ncbi:MAG TPA: ABC transporter ATP-binding protein [Pseudonocardiaceae bacterium]|nr:ABC transporter ATP-binding protein [Pseudonocardiaceae bacterium]
MSEIAGRQEVTWVHAEAPSGGQVLRKAIATQWRAVTGSSVLGASHQACEASVPVLIGVIIDRAVATGALSALVFWILVLAALFIVLSFSFRFAARIAERAAEQAAHQIRIQLTERVLDPRGGADTGWMSGALVNVATEDAKRVGAINMALPMGLAALTAMLVSAVALLNVSVPLGLLVLLGAPPLLWFAHLLGKPLERRTEVEQERAGHASGTAADLITGLRVLKGIGAEGAAVSRYRRTSQQSLVATLRAARAQAWHDGTIFALTGIFIAIVALVGGRLAAQGDISIGGLVTAVGLAQFLLTPLTMFTWVNAELAQARASAARVASVLAAPPAVRSADGRLPEHVTGRIQVRGLSHGPLRDVDLDIPAGEMVGVVASAPAATALLECLGRDADPAAGSVVLDGISLPEIQPGDVRAAILVAAHNADLFEGSLIDNVTAATSDGARQAGVERALSAAAVDEVAQSLPQGADTVISERGHSLSGGQRQRVALARALATNPPVLVVHDPTTAVDPVTEDRIAAGIRELRNGLTTIMVTTSPALLAVTDRVVVLDGGVVTLEGRHADLVHEHASYREAVLS